MGAIGQHEKAGLFALHELFYHHFGPGRGNFGTPGGLFNPGGGFFNPGGAPPKGFADLLKWQTGGGRAQWPDGIAITPTKPAPRVDDLTITMVGHATLLIQVAGLNLLTDPVWSLRASPFSFAGPKRATAPGILATQ